MLPSNLRKNYNKGLPKLSKLGERVKRPPTCSPTLKTLQSRICIEQGCRSIKLSLMERISLTCSVKNVRGCVEYDQLY